MLRLAGLRCKSWWPLLSWGKTTSRLHRLTCLRWCYWWPRLWWNCRGILLLICLIRRTRLMWHGRVRPVRAIRQGVIVSGVIGRRLTTHRRRRCKVVVARLRRRSSVQIHSGHLLIQLQNKRKINLKSFKIKQKTLHSPADFHFGHQDFDPNSEVEPLHKHSVAADSSFFECDDDGRSSSSSTLQKFTSTGKHGNVRGQ